MALDLRLVRVCCDIGAGSMKFLRPPLLLLVVGTAHALTDESGLSRRTPLTCADSVQFVGLDGRPSVHVPAATRDGSWAS